MNYIEFIEDLETIYGVFSSSTKAFIKGVCAVVEKMRYYEEEGRRIRFRLAIGIGIREIIPRVYKLQMRELDNSMSENEIEGITYKALKNTLSCARDNNDVYAVVNDNKIETGIFFLDPENMRDLYEKLFENGFIVFECVCENTIVVKSNKYEQEIYLDMEEDKTKGYLSSFDGLKDYTGKENRWLSIFEQVKRECHGTICLFVGSDFDLDSLSEELTNKPQELSDINVLSNGGSANDSVESMHALQIFLSLLNHDGITIIDILGRVRSFNNICNIKKRDNQEGKQYTGSRHAAFDTIKGWKNQGLVAVYFQSQEGEIEFFSFDTGTEEETFNARVLDLYYTKENTEKFLQQLDEVKSHKDLKPTEGWIKENYYNFLIPVNNLMSIHTGINNYYHEKEAVEFLSFYFDNPEWRHLVDTEFSDNDQYDFLRMQSMIAIIACIIGNSYGHTWGAQEGLQNIFMSIPQGWFIEFFEKKMYFDPYLLQDLSFKAPCSRWKSIVKPLVMEKLSGIENVDQIIGDAFNYSEGYFFRVQVIISSRENDNRAYY